MRISKSLFKNLTRCPNFCPLYDMYKFRSLHHVKSIHGIDVEDVYNLPEGEFDDEKEEMRDIFYSMFDEETGEDLTIESNAQLEAMQEYFTEIEIIAGKKISELFGGDVHYSKTTKEQKLFSFEEGENEYFCYLDGYLETDEGIKIFEVKGTTSNKFIKLGKKIKKDSEEDFLTIDSKEDIYESIFVRGPKGILYLREDLLDNIETDRLSIKDYERHRAKLFNRYGSDGTGRYVFDLAVERYIIENSLRQQGKEELIDSIKYYLVVLTGDYIFDGTYVDGKPYYGLDKNGRSLITLIDMTTITKEYQLIIDDQKRTIERYLENLSITNNNVGEFCELKKSTQCRFKPVCFKKVSIEGSILEYMKKHWAFSVQNGRKKERFTVYELINRGMYKMTDVPLNYLDKQYNIIQYQCITDNSTYINKEKIKMVINDLKYPLYHLDFETFGCPIPRYKGEKPYSQSLFQFSIHVEKERGKCDKVRDHHDFLATDHQDHREELVKKMIETIDLSNGGTVIVYNEAFEKTRLKELAQLFPEYAESLLKIRDHIFDLLHVLTGNKKMFLPYAHPYLTPDEAEAWAGSINYYHNKMAGSYSIKKVLPLFSDLSYANLGVRNGTEAVLVYSQLPHFTETEYQEKYLALREYCKQDTWAMVEILWGLQKIVEE
ncbi:MAG TPA: DUF2779 domain-containing protein [Acholeplasmataceae bacterium]|nr:DUF2779 domain-containing protein [Acholeplasmataceae bacterium]